MTPQGRDRDLYRAEAAEVAEQALEYLRASKELFVPSAELARALNLPPNRLGHVLRKHPSTFQLEKTYRAGSLITVVAIRPSLRSSSSSTN